MPIRFVSPNEAGAPSFGAQQRQTTEWHFEPWNGSTELARYNPLN